jgi:hypothetical protein
MMEAFRKALAELGLQPKDWYGPGVIAREELKRRGIMPVKKKGKVVDYGHYPSFLGAAKASTAQDWAHHAFSGGRIELTWQGVHCDPNNPIYQYDICSAYPSIIEPLPSMRNRRGTPERIEAWEKAGSQGPKPKRYVLVTKSIRRDG